MAENNDEQKDSSDNKPRAFETIEERLAKKRRKAPVSTLIFYIITLIIAVILMLWLRRGGMFIR
jgi:predicted nucleic acid-binding Zn ribbon protein